MKSHILAAVCLAVVIIFTSCGATVDVTKTAEGYFPPTNPNNIEIRFTLPHRPYVELGSVTVEGFDISEEAKMHNAIRAKAAALGANAVVIQNQGLTGGGRHPDRWATGVAIRYTAMPLPKPSATPEASATPQASATP
jgi:hypothetical protein